MKQRSPKYPLPLIAAALGGAGLLLRLALYLLEEPSGLLPAGHFLHIATVILSIVTGALMYKFSRRPGKHTEYKPKAAAFGAFFAGLWLLPVAFGILEQASGALDVLRTVLAFLSVPSLILTAWQHFKGRKPHFLTNGILCMFFLSHMICQYPLWCGNPQVEDYLLSLLACVFLSLAAYQRTACDLHMGNRRGLVFCSLMAGFFCICALVGAGDRRYYLAGALFALTNLYAIQPPKRQEGPHVSA